MPHFEFDRNQRLAPGSSSSGKAAVAVRWVLLGLSLAALVYGCVPANPPLPSWFPGVLLILTCTTTIAWQNRQLPMQSLISAGAIIGIMSGLISATGTLSGIPFGPFDYTERAGPNLSRHLPLAVPWLWITALLNARGVARLILRPFRSRPVYGLWVIGLTGLLMAGFALALDPFASALHRYWVWQPSKTTWTWYGAPWVAFPAWALCSVLILAFATPSLINKKPVKYPPDFFPLAMWCLILGFLGTRLFAGGMKAAGIFSIGLLSITSAGALVCALVRKRGSRGKESPSR